MTENAKLDTDQALIDHMVSFANDTFPTSGEIMPMWTLIDAKGETHIYLTPFSNQEEKDLTSIMIRAMVRVHDAVRLGFMSETWMSRAEGMSKEDASKIVPSKDPNRIEAVFFTVEGREGGGISGMCEIKRDAEGKGTLAPFDGSSFTHTEGRFANFFPQKEKVLH